MQWLCPAGAQVFENLNARFPLSASEELYQDSDGFLWIGTVAGLVRFDGYAAELHTHDPNDSASIAANNINAIGEDRHGQLWVGLQAHGLDIYHPDKRSFQHVALPLPRSSPAGISVNEICRDPQGGMWIGTPHGLWLLSDDDQPVVLRHYDQVKEDSNSLSGNRVIRVFADGNGRIWVGTDRGLNLYDRSNDRFVHRTHNPSFPAQQILDIAEDRNGQVWVSVRFAEIPLFRYDESEERFVADSAFAGRDLGDCRITFDLHNTLWISSRGAGAFRLEDAGSPPVHFDPRKRKLHGFRNEFSLRPLTDRYGNIWMAGTQLMKWPATGKPFRRIDTDGQPVSAIYGDGRRIWYAAGEPTVFDPATGESKPYWPPELPHERLSFIDDGPARRKLYRIRSFIGSKVLMSTVRNAFIWDTESNQFREFPTRYGGPFRDFAVAADSMALLICGNQGSPILLNLRDGEASRPEELSQILNPRCVTRTSDGAYWFGTSDRGVFRYDAVSGDIRHFGPEHPDPRHRLSDYFVNDIESAEDAVWVATNLGLNRIDPATLSVRQIRKQESFVHESVMSVQVDLKGKVWLATQQGLVCYDPEGERFTAYDRTDGLINATFMPGVRFRDQRGWLYFGGDQGVDYFDPGAIGSNIIPPDLYLTRVLVNNAPVDTVVAARHLEELRLGPGDRYIEVELLALHLTTPEGNQYAYRIPELDDEWRYLGLQRTLTLANLRPGTYTLQARTANADDVWSAERTMLRIHVRPPFWRTSWFVAIAAIVLGGTVVLSYRYRVGRIRAQERLKTDFNRQVAELESKALRAQMNPHFLFNSMNSVKSLIGQGDNTKAILYLTRFSQLIRLVLANSEKPMVRLQEELEALRLYLEIEQLRFQNFTYLISVSEEVDTDFVEVPPLILQPYVENAIWHGLMPKDTGERKLRVEVGKEGDFLRMTVEDNGIGRQQAGRLKMLGRSRKGGMGMRLTGDRLQLLEQTYGKQVSVSVEDLVEAGMATGTRVVIRLPWPE